MLMPPSGQQHHHLLQNWDHGPHHPYNFSTLFPTNSSSNNVPLDLTSCSASYLTSFSLRKNPLFLLHSEADHTGSTSSSSVVASTSTAMTSLVQTSLDEFEQDLSSFEQPLTSSSQALPMMVLDNCVWTIPESNGEQETAIDSTDLTSTAGLLGLCGQNPVFVFLGEDCLCDGQQTNPNDCIFVPSHSGNCTEITN
jgi:hypothetical protein